MSEVSLNPFTGILEGSMGTFGNIALVLGLVLIIFILVIVVIYMFTIKKAFWIRIHVFRLIGNTPTRVAIYRAREVNFGLAGDKLWRVAPNSALAMPFKVIKWISVGKFQAAPGEFWYWIRSDGEWINFIPTDIDIKSKEMNVRFVQEDMRLQRLATERILEQRLMNKNFWEKYGVIIGYVIFFLVITISIVIIFYQWSKLIEQMNPLVSMLTTSVKEAQNACVKESLVPALGMLIPVRWFRKWIKKN